MPLMVIKKSDYDNIMDILKEKKVNVLEDEYLEISNIDVLTQYLTPFYKNGNRININNNYLKPASDKVVNLALENSSSNSNTGVVVVSDKYLKNMIPVQSVVLGNYKDGNKEDREDAFVRSMRLINSDLYMVTRIDMVTQSLGLKVMLIYVGLYLGIIFAISSVTVLAITELSTSSDNKERYKILRELGASDKMINRAL